MKPTEHILVEVRRRILAFPIGHAFRLSDISAENPVLGWSKLVAPANSVLLLVRRGCVVVCGRQKVWVAHKNHYTSVMHYKSTPLLLEEWQEPVERWEDTLYGWREVCPELFTPPAKSAASVVHILSNYEGDSDASYE